MMRADGELLPRRYGSGERAPSPLAPFVGAERLPLPHRGRGPSHIPLASDAGLALRISQGWSSCASAVLFVLSYGSVLGVGDGLVVGGGGAEGWLGLAGGGGLVGGAGGGGGVGWRLVVV